MHVNIIQRLVTTKEIFSHRLTMIFPEGLPQLFYDLQPLFENAETAWTSWDDKLDSENLTQIADEQQKLAQGITTPDEIYRNL